MELIYLWVEDYKNIEKQGFNFSSRFECKYDEKKNELTIDENDNYIPDFFGENINVTAIVGKNGSGKSSILECITNLFLYNKLNSSKYILIVKNEELIYQTNFLNINTTIREKQIKGYNWYSYFFYNKEIDETYEKRHIISLEKNIIARKLANSFSSNSKFNLSSFMYLPNKIEIEPNLNEILMDISANNYSLNYLPKSMYNKIKKCIKIDDNFESLNEIEMGDILKSADELYKFLILLFYSNCQKETLLDKDKLIKNYEKCEFSLSKEKLNKFLEKKTIFLSDMSLEEKEFYFSEYHKSFKFDFIDLKSRRYNHLSHGEQVIFGTLLNLYSASLDLENKTIANYFIKRPLEYSLFFILDEPDLSLHPSWQKKYIDEVINLFEQINGEYHLIFTTHSPFLLSDIPKQNIIFLDKDENGNCKVVDGTKETFGQNIHTLLSDSFFMEGGLMGEFAKNKIRTIKVAHRYILHKHKKKFLIKKSYDISKRLIIENLPKFWQIQSIIGEPFLQKIVKNQLEEIELILLGRDEAIDKEIARLQALKASSKNA